MAYLRFSLIALMSFSLRLSARSLFKDITAHIAAGNQPIKVICKIRQIIPNAIFPLNIKDRKGRSIANNIILFFLEFYNYFSFVILNS
jgi:hypothetical protein